WPKCGPLPLGCMTPLKTLAGIYRSTQDGCTRRVYWHTSGPERAPVHTLYAARTRPGQPEEAPYVLELDYFTKRLAGFGCWVLLLDPTI
ncbi:hypothetical protein, partial [Hymenobacter lapidiphilus]